MTLVATHKDGRAARYRRPGGAWDVPPLGALLAGSPRRDDALVDGDVRLSTEALDDAVVRLAGGLRRAGVRRRDAVAWQLANRWEAVALFHACWRIGAIAVPVHHLAGEREIGVVERETDPALFVTADRLPELLDGRPVRAAASVPGSWPAVVLFTSGSSGEPKGVLHTHRALAHKARLMVGVHGLDDHDSVLMPAPMAHISGLLNGILLPTAAGMRTVVQARWDPEAALGLIEREQVSFMIGPPTFFVGLLGAPGFAPERVASLRLLSCGGAGVTPAFVEETAALLDCFVKRTYGSTEAPTVTTAHVGDSAERASTTDGRPTGEVEIAIDASSEVLVRGPELFAGYTAAERNADAFTAGGWFRTGDEGVLDGDGWLRITGRLKDVIIRGGENVAMAEVEAICEAHPAVRQAVAVGVPDDRLGERVAVVVVLAPGAAFDVAECGRWFESQGAARFKTPELVAVVDAVPTLAAGKPDRAALRARF